MANEGFYVLLWDITLGPEYGLLVRKNHGLLLGWIRAGLVIAMHLGTPCTSLTRARDAPGGPPPLRSNELPWGLPNLRPYVRRAQSVRRELACPFLVSSLQRSQAPQGALVHGEPPLLPSLDPPSCPCSRAHEGRSCCRHRLLHVVWTLPQEHIFHVLEGRPLRHRAVALSGREKRGLRPFRQSPRPAAWSEL